MSKTWIVFANASRARICEREEAGGELRDRMDFVHTQSRQSGSELGFDHPGHVERGIGLHLRGGTDLDPRTDPRQKEHERFAREIAQHLEKGVSSRQCGRIVLVASNPFLGVLKSQLGAAAAEAVWVTVPTDLLALQGRDLATRLGELLPG